MPRSCQICQKTYQKAVPRVKTRSKYNPTEKYFQKANLQWLKIPGLKRIKICKDCRRRILKDSTFLEKVKQMFK